jgi:hypothetical protein
MEVAPMPSPNQDEMDRRTSHLLFALAWLADKDANRDHLEAGAAVKVAGIVDGVVGNGKIVMPFAGMLQVGHDATVASSSAPKTVEVLAAAICRLPRTQQVAIFEDLPEYFAHHGELPVVKPELLEEVEQMLVTLRREKSSLRRGSVRFERTEVA